MMTLRKRKASASQRGIALIIALLVLLLLSAVGMGMVMMSNAETSVSSNFRDEQTAFFASKAGMEEVRDRLRSAAPNSLSGVLPATALPGAANAIIYVTNPVNGEVVAPWVTTGNNYPDDEYCKEFPPCGANLVAGTYVQQAASNAYQAAPPLPWKWVRVIAKENKSDTGAVRVTSVDGQINNNRVCFAGTNEISTAAASCTAANSNYVPVYELTALAVTPSGSRRMTQFEVRRTVFPPMPGAMIFDGPNPVYSPNPNSAAFGVSGTDAAQGPNAGTGCGPAVNEPAVGADGGAAAASLSGQVNRPGSYTSNTPYTATPAVSDVSGALGPLTTVDGLANLVNSITNAAGSNVFPNANNATPTNLGTSASPAINVVQGDYTFPGSGTGILLVTGTLTFNGTPSFNGLILVIGKGSVQKNGGGGGTLNGSLFVANLYSDVPPTHTNLIPLGANNPPGIPTIAWNGGGNATIQYDSCWINAVTQVFPYRIVAQRELIY
jgi:Tfp pilus assembly protein PilX